MNSLRPLLIVLCGCLGLTSCVSSDDLDAMSRRLYALEQRVDRMEEVRQNQADTAADVDTIGSRVSSLEGKVNALNRRLQVTAPPSDYPAPPSLTTTTDSTKTTDSTRTAPRDMSSTAPSTAAEELASTSSQVPSDPSQALYDKALEQFNAKNYQAARATWNDFTQQYKKHALAPNAYFWQGECYYQLRDYPKAILAYQEVIGKYSKSNKYPSALLKQGISFIIIGKKQAGRLVLNDLIKKFPNSPEAQRADEFLKSSN